MAKKKKNIKTKLKEYQWVTILIISIFIAMYVYGMVKIYFPDPIHIGVGQYLDIATGVTIVGLLLSGIILTIIFKKNKREIGTSEYTTIKRKKKKKVKK